MASSHLPRVLHNLPDRRVTVQEGDRKTEHPGSLTISEARGADGEAVTLTLAADPAAAREQAMSVSLSAEDVASLVSALTEARSED